MKNEKTKMMSLDEALKKSHESVQVLDEVLKNKFIDDETAAAIERGNKFISKGRPKVDEGNKKKMKSFYLSDNEVVMIEKVAKNYGMKVMEYVKFVLDKELRKEGVL